MTKAWNNVKTAVLLAAMFALILLIGSFFGRQGLLIAFMFGGLMNVITFFFSDKIALASMQARLVDRASAPDLYEMVQRLSENARLPMPRVYICPHESPNAFATGRNPSNAAVAVTQGALRLLSYDELEGVIGHELAHVKNRDTLISCVAATIAGAISFVAHMVFMMSVYGGGQSRDDRDSGGAGLIGGILMLILAPIAAALIQMAISRSREFVADADGAAIAGTPVGLISALQKLDAYAKRIPLQGEMPAQNHLFIIQPFSGESLANLFSTHPPTQQRIARLSELA